MDATTTLNIAQLPEAVRQQLIDYYHFLLEKYASDSAETESVPDDTMSKKERFLAHVRENRFTLPDDYKFDRDWANER